jgi:hypothetical protein
VPERVLEQIVHDFRRERVGVDLDRNDPAAISTSGWGISPTAWAIIGSSGCQTGWYTPIIWYSRENWRFFLISSTSPIDRERYTSLSGCIRSSWRRVRYQARPVTSLPIS